MLRQKRSFPLQRQRPVLARLTGRASGWVTREEDPDFFARKHRERLLLVVGLLMLILGSAVGGVLDSDATKGESDILPVVHMKSRQDGAWLNIQP